MALRIPLTRVRPVVLFLTTVLVIAPPTRAVKCSNSAAGPVTEIKGKFGHSLTLNAEVEESTFLRKWSRTLIDMSGNGMTSLLVLWNGTSLLWSEPTLQRYYTALYKEEPAKASFKLEILKLNCDHRGLFFCSFTVLTGSGNCETKFNVNITADPSPPTSPNQTVQANPGEQVTVLCEANVGYPQGNIHWYIVPADGSNARRLPSDAPAIESAGDCRLYARSKLVTTIQNVDHLSKLRCVTKNYLDQSTDYIEMEIQVKGQTTPKPTSAPCTGAQCIESVGDNQDGGAAILSLSVFSVLLPVLTFASVV